MERPRNLLSFFFMFFPFWFLFISNNQAIRVAEAQKSSSSSNKNGSVVVDVGVVLDFDVVIGKKNWASISLAIEDFYASHESYTTRVVLHPRSSQGDIVGAASAAVDLMKNVNAQAIIGPTTSSQTEFVASLGNKTQVPIVSYSATSPSLSSVTTPYFIRATLNDSVQTGAIADIVKFYGWREVVLVYEDTDYGAGIIPSLIDVFNAIDTQVPYRCVVPTNAKDDWIVKELVKLMNMQTRVFVVHMSPNIGSRFFEQVHYVGLMSPGYVWIITDSMTNVLSNLDPTTLDSMDGVLGIRTHIPRSPALSSFTSRWSTRVSRDNASLIPLPSKPTIFQLHSYDAAWALALAAESIKISASSSSSSSNSKTNSSSSSSLTDLAHLKVSKTGPQLLDSIRAVQFRGLSGNFSLINGQLQSSFFEIVNVVGEGGIRRVGFWSPEVHLKKHVKRGSDSGLRSVIWPGDSKEQPKGWEIPTMGKKLTVMVPVKEGFKEFVSVNKNEVTGTVNVTGYCIDIFEAVMNTIPYGVAYEYVLFNGSSYDDLVSQVYYQKVDAVIGDTTIIANRSHYVDFTLPYTESGVSMVVPVKDDNSKKVWIFLQPLTTDLWLASLGFFFFTGFVVWVIEHRINTEFRGPPSQQMGTIFYFAFSTLVFAHKERLESNLSRFAVIIWVFVVLILTSSYTASLTSMLTVQQLQPTVADVSELVKNGDYVGYQDGSFVKELLIQGLNFNEKKLINYSTVQQYAEALSLGSKNGGVAAIFDEIPYLRLFLSENCANYAMVGQTYKTDGFGFVFPRGSPLTPDISRAVLNVTEGDSMTLIEKKWFGNQSTCPTDANSFTSNSLNFRSFEGLFLITGSVSLLALFVFFFSFLYKEWDELKASASQNSLRRRLVQWWAHYDAKDLSSHTFKDYATSVENHSRSGHDNSGRPVVHVEGSQSPASVITDLSGLNFGSPDDGRSFTEGDEPRFRSPPEETVIEMDEIRDGR